MIMAKILIAEDNDMNIRLFSDLLKSKNHEVFECRNGGKIISMVKKVRPDLILMDIQMPEVDGLTATKMIRKTPHISDTKIIAVTAFALDGDAERILAAGVNAYISKPISIPVFFQTIEDTLKSNAG